MASMRFAWVVVLSFLITGVLLFGCTQQSQSTDTDKSNQSQVVPVTVTVNPGNASANTVIISNFAFSPATLTVASGTTVKWINRDSAPHSIKSLAFSSPTMNKGESFEHQFVTPGTYDYVCGIHSSMKGKIVVQ